MGRTPAFSTGQLPHPIVDDCTVHRRTVRAHTQCGVGSWPCHTTLGGKGRGEWGVWHDASLCCCRQRAAPTGACIGLSPLILALLLNPFPPQAGVPIGLSPPCALRLPAWPFRTSLLPFLSLRRLCQWSPQTWLVSLLCVESTQMKATAIAVGQVRPSGHPKPAVRYLSPTVAVGP